LISIVFSEGPLAGERRELDREMTLGRADCDVTVTDHEVSRRHLVLRPAGTKLLVEDLGSKNGTFVNGSRISEAVRVGDRDVIHLGTCELVVQVTAPRDPSAPHPVPAAAGAPAATGGLPGAFWTVTGLVEISVILAAATFLVYYAVG
jgi:predicted component of type VI protein secretion system